MVTLLCFLVLSVSTPADTIRLPKDLPKPPNPPRSQERDIMPNAKPSFRSRMPVHKPDDDVNVPMPNSAAGSRSFQIPPIKPIPGDSGKRRNND